MTKKNELEKLVPVVKYECPVCKESFVTERKCLDHLRSHKDDETVRTVYLNREEDGEFTFDAGSVHHMAPGLDERYSTPSKSTSWRERWYVEARNNPNSIAKAEKKLVQAALEWYRAGLSQLEVLETNPEQEEEEAE